jgi:DNA-binding transcriptional MerR regulator
MKLITASGVLQLTGLTADQLREWTSRRGLIQPDIKPKGPGSRAMYSWQTVLVLRLAVVLKEILHVELQAHRATLSNLTLRLKKSSFPSLRGKALALNSDGSVDFLSNFEVPTHKKDRIILQLDSHLDIIATSFDSGQRIHQLPLFPAVSVR